MPISSQYITPKNPNGVKLYQTTALTTVIKYCLTLGVDLYSSGNIVRNRGKPILRELCNFIVPMIG